MNYNHGADLSYSVATSRDVLSEGEEALEGLVLRDKIIRNKLSTNSNKLKYFLITMAAIGSIFGLVLLAFLVLRSSNSQPVTGNNNNTIKGLAEQLKAIGPDQRNDKELLNKAWERHYEMVQGLVGCGTPQPRALKISSLFEEADRFYSPEYALLHVCERGVGMCGSLQEDCGPVGPPEEVYIPIMVTYLGTGEAELEILRFQNHTQCGCVLEDGT